MELSNPNKSLSQQLFCAIRQTWVAASPEEMVRQHLIIRMTQELGYPKTSICLEKELRQICQPSNVKLPKRRTDLLVFTQNLSLSEKLSPLLLVECKAIKLTSKMVRQVIGYNFYLKAPFLALVNPYEARFGYYCSSQKDFIFHQGFPSYQSLTSTYSK